MKQYRFLLPILLSTFIVGTFLEAKEFGQRVYSPAQAPMTPHMIQKLDKRFGKHQAVKRNFRDQKDFLSRRHAQHQIKYPEQRPRPHHSFKQRGYPYTKRGWELAYLHDRAPFYDRHGYYYGYFNRHGYSFEGQFYRYDKWYSYQDRIRGKELFKERYYIPANYLYYGFDPSPRR